MSSATLLALPEEIRHRIYRYVYPPAPTSAPIPLAPLSHALPSASKQLYCESLQYYRTTTDIYYTGSHFSLLHDYATPEPEVELAARILAIQEEDFNKITKLTITVRPQSSIAPDNSKDWIYTLVHPLHGWRIERPVESPDSYLHSSKLPNDPGRCETYRRFRPERMPIVVLLVQKYKWHHLWKYHAGESELSAACGADGGSLQHGLRTNVLNMVKIGWWTDVRPPRRLFRTTLV
nr:hypothetical protein B0A51_09201 [Rachicladosporium sp. CCFEE 5018]